MSTDKAQQLRLMVAFLLLAMAGVLVINYNESRDDRLQMQTCVNSGGEWVRDRGSYYECRRGE